MKGISLPINMIVIVAIAVLVLVVTAGFFGGFFGSNVGTIQLEQAISNACNQLRSLYNCAPSGLGTVQVLYQGVGDDKPAQYTLAGLCTQKLGGGQAQKQATNVFGVTDGNNKCLLTCGCPVSGGGGA